MTPRLPVSIRQRVAILSRGKGKVHVLRTDTHTLCGLDLVVVSKNAQIEWTVNGKLPACGRCSQIAQRKKA